MTTQELRELDAWIAEHVMGWNGCSCRNGVYPKWGQKEYDRMRNSNPHWIATWPEQEPDIKCNHFPSYTSDPAAAMDVLKKCAEYLEGDMSILLCDEIWTVAWVDWNAEGRADAVKAESLELAICLFAKQLFSQTTK